MRTSLSKGGGGTRLEDKRNEIRKQTQKKQKGKEEKRKEMCAFGQKYMRALQLTEKETPIKGQEREERSMCVCVFVGTKPT
jgi:uncharacterized membrane protein